MKMTNNHNLPQCYFNAVKRDDYNMHGDSDMVSDAPKISASTLASSTPRQYVLRERHGDEIEVDCLDRLWAFWGKGAHHILEQGAANSDITEVRLFYGNKTSHRAEGLTNGWILSGQFDLLDKDGVLWDAKTTKTFNAKQMIKDNAVKKEWEAQLNIYDFLCRKNSTNVQGREVTALKILLFVVDYRTSERKYQGTEYPDHPVYEISVNRWSAKEQDDYIKSRIKEFQDATKELSDFLPLCTPEERWHVPPKFACMQAGRKKARKLETTKEELLKWMSRQAKPLVENENGISIVERKGADRRCEQYCDVSKFCSYIQFPHLSELSEETKKRKG